MKVQLSKGYNDLRMTRESRFKHSEESKVNFWDKLKELNTITSRTKEGRLNALAKLAADVEAIRLSQLTTYADESVDRPFLTPDLLLEEKDRYEKMAEMAEGAKAEGGDEEGSKGESQEDQ